ncbi:MarR family winged helix-turn-helix transcriptional regulator [Paucilactobacillus nenjiangensis]|uniref:MarR family winged helix-turn-helix transcriptional regulator n=1 Tax=Paucilactobacillus nenjiangensis TaxID=1296540 RepID=UPI0028D4C003|nr:MarR family winged helix-turn-helix transcriptional regulator [Paucilactobacillus nenjiangensis]
MEQNLARLIKKTSNQMTRKFDKFAREFDLTSVQISVIDYMSQNPTIEIQQRNVEHEFNIQRSTATVLLQKMEQKDLIIRTTSKDDARQKTLNLTDKAKALAVDISAYSDRQQARITQQFSTTEVENFKNILEYITEINKE